MKKGWMLYYGMLIMCITSCSHCDISMRTDNVKFVEFDLFKTDENEPVLIDWGDGNKNEYTENGKVKHEYAISKSYVIRINGKIRILDCYCGHSYDCKLVSLNVANNENLRELCCRSTGVNSLNLTNCTSLYELDCGNNKLTSLDVSSTPALSTLHCDGNLLTFLDVSKTLELENLNCDANQINVLDVSKNKELKSLSCGMNNLKNIDIKNNAKLSSLYCTKNFLTKLDISKNPHLLHIHCSDNNLSALALNQIYENLPRKLHPAKDPLFLFSGEGVYTLDVRNNPGTKQSNIGIARYKGWNVW